MWCQQTSWRSQFCNASEKDEFNEKGNKPITEVKLNNKPNLN